MIDEAKIFLQRLMVDIWTLKVDIRETRRKCGERWRVLLWSQRITRIVINRMLGNSVTL